MRLRDRAAEENLLLVFTVAQAPQLLAHTPLSHHASGQIGGLLDVVARPCRHLLGTEDQFLCHATAKHHGQAGFDLVLMKGVPIPLRQVHGDAERAPARNDRDLVQRIVARHE